MTFEVLLPYLIAGGVGWAVRHFNVLNKLKTTLAGPNPATVASGAPPSTALDAIKADVSAVTSKIAQGWPHVFSGSHPVLSDALMAAIKQAAADEAAGHIASLKAELPNLMLAAIHGAAASVAASAAPATTTPAPQA